MEVDSDEEEEEEKPQRGKKGKAVKRKMWFTNFFYSNIKQHLNYLKSLLQIPIMFFSFTHTVKSSPPFKYLKILV